MFKIENRTIPLDTPFTHNGIQYPANWLRLTSLEEKTAIGITEEADKARADDRFYWDGNLDNPKDIDEIKKILISQIKSQAASLLAPTDWKVIRSSETEVLLDNETKADRAAIRTKSNDLETLITECDTVDKLAALKLSWE